MSGIVQVSHTRDLAAARERALMLTSGLLDEVRAHDVVLVVSELVTNALSYGSGSISVAIDVLVDRVTVTVTSDSAGPFERSIDRVPDEEPTGRGLQIVHRVADSVEIANSDGRVAVVCCFDS